MRNLSLIMYDLCVLEVPTAQLAMGGWAGSTKKKSFFLASICRPVRGRPARAYPWGHVAVWDKPWVAWLGAGHRANEWKIAPTKTKTWS